MLLGNTAEPTVVSMPGYRTSRGKLPSMKVSSEVDNRLGVRTPLCKSNFDSEEESSLRCSRVALMAENAALMLFCKKDLVTGCCCWFQSC